MSDQNPTTPDPTGATPGYTPPPADPYGSPAGAYPPPPAPGTPGGYPPVPSGPAGTDGLAAWPTRALGGLVDYVAPAVVFGVVGSILSNVSSTLGSLVQAVLGIGWLIYLGFLVGTYGITPGKAIAKVKIVSESTGDVIGVGPAIGRQFAHIIDSIICYIGWLFPLWDAKKQTLADKILKTVAIDNSADPNAGQIRWS